MWFPFLNLRPRLASGACAILVSTNRSKKCQHVRIVGKTEKKYRVESLSNIWVGDERVVLYIGKILNLALD